MSGVLDIVPARTALPALVAAAGGKARDALPRILRRPDPQPAHPPRLRAGDAGVSGLVRARRRRVDRRRDSRCTSRPTSSSSAASARRRR